MSDAKITYDVARYSEHDDPTHHWSLTALRFPTYGLTSERVRSARWKPCMVTSGRDTHLRSIGQHLHRCPSFTRQRHTGLPRGSASHSP